MDMNIDQGSTVFLATAPLICFFEEHEQYCPVTERFFDRVYEVRGRFIASLVTYIDVLTLPEREGEHHTHKPGSPLI